MHQQIHLKLLLLLESTGRGYYLPVRVPIRHVDVGYVRPGEYEPFDYKRITWDAETVAESKTGLQFTAELDPFDFLQLTFDVPNARKPQAATKLRRYINAQFRRSSPGVWSARGIVLDLVGDKDERSQLQLTVTAVPPVQGH